MLKAMVQVRGLLLCAAVATASMEQTDSTDGVALMRKEVRPHQSWPTMRDLDFVRDIPEGPIDRPFLEALVERARVEAGHPKDVSPGKVNALLEVHSDLATKANMTWKFPNIFNWLLPPTTFGWGWLCARASALAYRHSYIGLLVNPLFLIHKSDMEKAGWKSEEQFSITDFPGSDYAEVWKNGQKCILAFRGSEDLWDFFNDVTVNPVEYMGLPDVSEGVKKEFDLVYQKMKNSPGMAALKSCTELAVTGHSLGGAIAGLFATLANKNGDPLGIGLKVDHLYQYGPIPLSGTPASNDKSNDGCFEGRRFYNMAGTATDFAIWVGSKFSNAVPGTLTHPKLRAQGKSTNGATVEDIECSQAWAIPSRNASQDFLRNELNIPLHTPQFYVSAMSTSD